MQLKGGLLALALGMPGVSGCAMPDSGQLGQEDVVSLPIDQELMGGADQLFPLSTYFGVCIDRTAITGARLSSGMQSKHYATVVEIDAGRGALLINVGNLSVMPEYDLRDVESSTGSRRLQAGELDGRGLLLVTEFEGGGSNMVTIDFDSNDEGAVRGAYHVANSVVGCHLVSTTSN